MGDMDGDTADAAGCAMDNIANVSMEGAEQRGGNQRDHRRRKLYSSLTIWKIPAFAKES